MNLILSHKLNKISYCAIRGVSNSKRFYFIKSGYRIRNEDVELSHIEIKDNTKDVQLNMIVLHGLLGNKFNLRGICKRPEVITMIFIYVLDNIEEKLLFG